MSLIKNPHKKNMSRCGTNIFLSYYLLGILLSINSTSNYIPANMQKLATSDSIDTREKASINDLITMAA